MPFWRKKDKDFDPPVARKNTFSGIDERDKNFNPLDGLALNELETDVTRLKELIGSSWLVGRDDKERPLLDSILRRLNVIEDHLRESKMRGDPPSEEWLRRIEALRARMSDWWDIPRDNLRP